MHVFRATSHFRSEPSGLTILIWPLVMVVLGPKLRRIGSAALASGWAARTSLAASSPVAEAAKLFRRVRVWLGG
jgi:hypothetical protein